jgi:predicted acetyltransferase
MKTVHLITCTKADLGTLALLNKQLIEDEKHENQMSLEQLKERMWLFVNTDYRAYIFRNDDTITGYALVDITKEPLCLRQFFICREFRRQGYGTIAFNRLMETLCTSAIDIEVLFWNERGKSFWKSLGFCERSVYMRFKK